MSTERDADIRLIPATPAGGYNRWRAVCLTCGWLTRPVRYETAVSKRDRHDVAHFADALADIAGLE